MDDTLRQCRKCRDIKPPYEFAFKDQASGRRHAICRTCTRDYAKEWHQRTKEVTRESRNKNHKSWRAKKKAEAQARVNAIKSAPCCDCRQKFKPWQMQFDHRDPSTKLFDIAKAVHWSYRGRYSLEAILVEIAKCDLVCANCHADRTYQRTHRTGA